MDIRRNLHHIVVVQIGNLEKKWNVYHTGDRREIIVRDIIALVKKHLALQRAHTESRVEVRIVLLLYPIRY